MQNIGGHTDCAAICNKSKSCTKRAHTSTYPCVFKLTSTHLQADWTTFQWVRLSRTFLHVEHSYTASHHNTASTLRSLAARHAALRSSKGKLIRVGSRTSSIVPLQRRTFTSKPSIAAGMGGLGTSVWSWLAQEIIEFTMFQSHCQMSAAHRFWCKYGHNIIPIVNIHLYGNSNHYEIFFWLYLTT